MLQPLNPSVHTTPLEGIMGLTHHLAEKPVDDGPGVFTTLFYLLAGGLIVWAVCGVLSAVADSSRESDATADLTSQYHGAPIRVTGVDVDNHRQVSFTLTGPNGQPLACTAVPSAGPDDHYTYLLADIGPVPCREAMATHQH
jgi:hypothetical protein